MKATVPYGANGNSVPRSNKIEYQREYRSRNMPGAKRARAVNRARQRAERRLATERHPKELAAFLRGCTVSHREREAYRSKVFSLIARRHPVEYAALIQEELSSSTSRPRSHALW